MMRLVIFFVVLAFLQVHTAHAQPATPIDSLQQELANTTDKQSRAQLMLSIATKLPIEDSTRIDGYFREVIEVAKSQQNTVLEIIALANYGRHLYMRYAFDEAEKRFSEADSLLVNADQETRTRYTPAVKSLLAAIFVARGETENAQRAYQQLIDLWTEAGNLFEVSQAHRNIGVLFFNKGQYQNALDYYKQSLEIYDVTDPQHRDIGRTQLDLASAYNELDSLEQLRNCLTDAGKRFATVTDTLEQMAPYYFLMGEYQRKTGNGRRAIEMYGTSLDIARKYHHVHALTNTLQALADVHFTRGEYSRALQLMEEYLQLSYTLKDYEFRRVAYKRLAEIEHALSRHERAHSYWQRYAAEIDSLNVTDVANRLHELDRQYQLASREREILDLQLKNERAEWLSQRNLLYAWIAAGLVFLAAVISYILYRNVLKQKKIVSQQDALHELEIATVKQEHRIGMLSAMIAGEEKERSRIGKDLHDGIGALLSGIRMSLDALGEQRTENSHTPHTAAHLAKHVDDTIHEVRRIAHSMMPDLLEKYGLSEALDAFCKRLTNAKTRIDYQAIRVQHAFPPDAEMSLYRIAQELVNNAVKHAKASHILVQLQESDGRLSLTVEDDGVGFDPQDASEASHAGLANVLSRVAHLNGTLDIHSSPGTGTSVTVECATV